MKKLICLIALSLMLTACTNDSTDRASQAVAPASPAVEKTAQQATNTPQQAVVQVADGAQIYQQSCRSCHDSGAMGAPKFGNDRLNADIEVLVENSIKGIGMMPARGGNASLSDDDVRAAVKYMVEESK